MANIYNTTNLRGFITSPVKPADILFIWGDDIIAVIYQPVEPSDIFDLTHWWYKISQGSARILNKIPVVSSIGDYDKLYMMQESMISLNKYLVIKGLKEIDYVNTIGKPVYANPPLDSNLFNKIYNAGRFKNYEDLSQSARVRLIQYMIFWLYRNSLSDSKVRQALAGSEVLKIYDDSKKSLTANTLPVKSIIEAEKDLTEFEKTEKQRYPGLWIDIKKILIKTLIVAGSGIALYYGFKLYLASKSGKKVFNAGRKALT
ncbi:MAG TPA: hypothetical protein PKY81_10780 [bacterium]|nr:hypothetical protein [bacterium]HPN31433.1 hypothetical protein [bacterium]